MEVNDVVTKLLCLIFFWYLVIPIVKILVRYTFKKAVFTKRGSLKKYGNWAVVTGCTDGIGKAYAQLLAKEGMNIILISRTEEKLKVLSEELESDYKIMTKICTVDFTENDVYERIGQAIAGMDIGVVINNVGMAARLTTIYDTELLTDKDMKSLINCNVYSCIGMIRLILPGMISRDHGGVIVNVASTSAELPFPFSTLYSASKSFMDALTRSLRLEVSYEGHHDIDIQCVLPLFVATKMTRQSPSFFAPSPLDFADSALSLIGVESRTTGCFSHDLQHFVFSSLLPTRIFNKFITNFMAIAMKRQKAKMKSKQM